MKWHFYNPNKPWILYWAWKSLKTHTSDLDMIAKNEERSRTQLVFQSPKKSSWEFLYPVKKQLLQAVFCWKIVHTGRCLVIRSIYRLVKVAFNALSGVFASKMSFWWSFFNWIEKFSWTFFWALKNKLSAWSFFIFSYHIQIRSMGFERFSRPVKNSWFVWVVKMSFHGTLSYFELFYKISIKISIQ